MAKVNPTIHSVSPVTNTAPVQTTTAATATAWDASTASTRLTPSQYNALISSSPEASNAYGYDEAQSVWKLGYSAPSASSTLESQTNTTMQNEYDENVATAEELGLPEGTAYESIEDVVNAQLASNERNLASANQSAGASDFANAVSLDELKKQATSSMAVLDAAKATTREGTGSTTSSLIAADYGSRMTNKVKAAEAQIQAGKAEQATALANLESAQRSGNQTLIEQYQQDYDNAYLQVQQAETDYMNAYSTYSDTKIKEQTAKETSLTTFTGLVDTGVELDVNAIQGFADSLGIDFKTAYDYYQGSQAVRDDKTLSTEEKQIKNAQAAQDLQDQITGMDTQAAKNIKAYISLVQSGASADVISAFKSAAGITDYNDPFTVADLKAKNLQNEIDQYIVDNQGKIPPEGSPERLDYDIKVAELAKAEYEIAQLNGTNTGTVDQDTASQIFTLTEGEGKYAAGWQCGQAYNLITNEGGAGTTWESKKSLITKTSSPTVGNGLVLRIGDSDVGHIENVISVNGNQIQTVSWNRNLDGQQTIQTYDINALDERYGSGNWGFTDSTLKSEYASALSLAKNSDIGSAISGALNNMVGGLTASQGESYIDTIKSYVEAGDYASAQDALESATVYALPTAAASESYMGRVTTLNLLENIKTDLATYEAKGGDTNLFTGNISKLANKVGQITDPELTKIYTKIVSSLQAYRRSMTGVAFGEGETVEYKSIFPDIDNVSELNIAKIDALTENFDLTNKATQELLWGKKNYDAIYGVETESTSTTTPTTDWSSIDVETGDDLLNNITIPQ